MNFRIENDKIFSLASGDCVAIIVDGEVKMQPGKNAMTPRVKAFYEENKPAGTAEESSKDMAPESMPCDIIDPDEEFEEEVNTHSLNEELSRERIVFGDAPATGGTSAPNPAEKTAGAAADKTPEALSIWDIPKEILPVFSPAMGVADPAFKAFVKKYHLNHEQIVELVRRLERNK